MVAGLDALRLYPPCGCELVAPILPDRANHPVKRRQRKYFSFPEFGFIVDMFRPAHERGVSRSSRHAGRDAVDAGGVGAKSNRRAGFGS
jgi:hypothetical protein